jgi:hypothetical protein
MIIIWLFVKTNLPIVIYYLDINKIDTINNYLSIYLILILLIFKKVFY